jgi:hypothetical protein
LVTTTEQLAHERLTTVRGRVDLATRRGLANFLRLVRVQKSVEDFKNGIMFISVSQVLSSAIAEFVKVGLKISLVLAQDDWRPPALVVLELNSTGYFGAGEQPTCDAHDLASMLEPDEKETDIVNWHAMAIGAGDPREEESGTHQPLYAKAHGGLPAARHDTSGIRTCRLTETHRKHHTPS